MSGRDRQTSCKELEMKKGQTAPAANNGSEEWSQDTVKLVLRLGGGCRWVSHSSRGDCRLCPECLRGLKLEVELGDKFLPPQRALLQTLACWSECFSKSCSHYATLQSGCMVSCMLVEMDFCPHGGLVFRHEGFLGQFYESVLYDLERWTCLPHSKNPVPQEAHGQILYSGCKCIPQGSWGIHQCLPWETPRSLAKPPL